AATIKLDAAGAEFAIEKGNVSGELSQDYTAKGADIVLNLKAGSAVAVSDLNYDAGVYKGRLQGSLLLGENSKLTTTTGSFALRNMKAKVDFQVSQNADGSATVANNGTQTVETGVVQFESANKKTQLHGSGFGLAVEKLIYTKAKDSEGL